MNSVTIGMKRWQNFQALWKVKTGIEQQVREVATILENSLDKEQVGQLSPQEQSLCIANLGKTAGVLWMMECHELALLADEVMGLLEDAASIDIEQDKPQIIEIRQLAFVALEDFPALVDGVLSGQIRHWHGYSQIFNKIRKARNRSLVFSSKTLLTKKSVNFRKAFAARPEHLKALLDQQLKRYNDLKKRLHSNSNVMESVRKLHAVFFELEVMSRDFRLATLWGLCAAIAEALPEDQANLENPTIKLLGSFSTILQMVSDKGVKALHQSIPDEILKRILAALARLPATTERLCAIKSWFELDLQLAAAWQKDNQELLVSYHRKDAFAKAIRLITERTGQLSDTINDAIAAGESTPQQLETFTSALLGIQHSITTLGMPSLVELLALCTTASPAAPATDLFEAVITDYLDRCAQTLYRCELALLRRAEELERAVFVSQAGKHTSTALTGVKLNVVLEAMKNLEQVVVAINDCAEADWDMGKLADVARLLRGAHAALAAVPLAAAAELCAAAQNFVVTKLASGELTAADPAFENTTNAFAHLIISGILYLEQVSIGRLENCQRIEHECNAYLEILGAGPLVSITVADKSVNDALGLVVDSGVISVSVADIRGNAAVTLTLDGGAAVSISTVDMLATETAEAVTGATAISVVDGAADEAIEHAADASVAGGTGESASEVNESIANAKHDGSVSTSIKVNSATDEDDEIHEIFVAEAGELLEQINDCLAALTRRQDDAEALADLRRSCHTLKGSGRMVGAEAVGALAWSVENLLNNVMSGRLQIGTPMLDALKQVPDKLLTLVADFEGKLPSALDAGMVAADVARIEVFLAHDVPVAAAATVKVAEASNEMAAEPMINAVPDDTRETKLELPVAAAVDAIVVTADQESPQDFDVQQTGHPVERQGAPESEPYIEQQVAQSLELQAEQETEQKIILSFAQHTAVPQTEEQTAHEMELPVAQEATELLEQTVEPQLEQEVEPSLEQTVKPSLEQHGECAIPAASEQTPLLTDDVRIDEFEEPAIAAALESAVDTELPATAYAVPPVDVDLPHLDETAAIPSYESATDETAVVKAEPRMTLAQQEVAQADLAQPMEQDEQQVAATAVIPELPDAIIDSQSPIAGDAEIQVVELTAEDASAAIPSVTNELLGVADEAKLSEPAALIDESMESVVAVTEVNLLNDVEQAELVTIVHETVEQIVEVAEDNLHDLADDHGQAELVATAPETAEQIGVVAEENLHDITDDLVQAQPVVAADNAIQPVSAANTQDIVYEEFVGPADDTIQPVAAVTATNLHDVALDDLGQTEPAVADVIPSVVTIAEADSHDVEPYRVPSQMLLTHEPAAVAEHEAVLNITNEIEPPVSQESTAALPGHAEFADPQHAEFRHVEEIEIKPITADQDSTVAEITAAAPKASIATTVFDVSAIAQGIDALFVYVTATASQPLAAAVTDVLNEKTGEPVIDAAITDTARAEPAARIEESASAAAAPVDLQNWHNAEIAALPQKLLAYTPIAFSAELELTAEVVQVAEQTALTRSPYQTELSGLQKIAESPAATGAIALTAEEHGWHSAVQDALQQKLLTREPAAQETAHESALSSAEPSDQQFAQESLAALSHHQTDAEDELAAQIENIVEAVITGKDAPSPTETTAQEFLQQLPAQPIMALETGPEVISHAEHQESLTPASEPPSADVAQVAFVDPIIDLFPDEARVPELAFAVGVAVDAADAQSWYSHEMQEPVPEEFAVDYTVLVEPQREAAVHVEDAQQVEYKVEHEAAAVEQPIIIAVDGLVEDAREPLLLTGPANVVENYFVAAIENAGTPEPAIIDTQNLHTSETLETLPKDFLADAAHALETRQAAALDAAERIAREIAHEMKLESSLETTQEVLPEVEQVVEQIVEQKFEQKVEQEISHEVAHEVRQEVEQESPAELAGENICVELNVVAAADEAAREPALGNLGAETAVQQSVVTAEDFVETVAAITLTPTEIQNTVTQAFFVDVNSAAAPCGNVMQDDAYEPPQKVAQEVRQEIAREVTQDLNLETEQQAPADLAKSITADVVDPTLGAGTEREIAEEVIQDAAQQFLAHPADQAEPTADVAVNSNPVAEADHEITREVTEEVPQETGQQILANPTDQAEPIVAAVAIDPNLVVDANTDFAVSGNNTSDETPLEPEVTDKATDNLAEVLRAEFRLKINRIREYLDGSVSVDAEGQSITSTSYLIPVHTLYGTGRVAGLTQLGIAAGRLEKLLQDHPYKSIGSGLQALLGSFCAIIENIIENSAFDSGFVPPVGLQQELDAFLLALDQVRMEMAGRASADADDEIVQVPDKADTVKVSDQDALVLEGFLGETRATSAQIQQLYVSFRKDNVHDRNLARRLREQFVLFEGAASVAQQDAIAPVCRELASAYQQYADGLYVVNETVIILLDMCHGHINACMKSLESGTPVETQAGDLHTELKLAIAQMISLRNETNIQVAEEKVEDSLLAVFIEEAGEILQELDSKIADWQQAPDDKDILDDLLRSLHTLKGSAALVGEKDLSESAHRFETCIIESGRTRRNRDKHFFAEVDRHLNVLQVLFALYHTDANGRLVKTPIAEEELKRLMRVDVAQFIEDKLAAAARIMSVMGLEPLKYEAPQQPAPQAPAESAPVKAASDGVADKKVTPIRKGLVPDANAQPGLVVDEHVRVSANLLKSLLNDADEISIARNRVEQTMADMQILMGDMEETLSRIESSMNSFEFHAKTRAGIRQAETSIGKLQGETGESTAAKGFDALEMDKYTELQQIVLSLLEDYNDVMDIKNNVSGKIRSMSTILMDQQRSTNKLQEGLVSSQMVPFAGIAPRLRRLVRQVSTELDKQVTINFGNPEGKIDRSVLQALINPIEHMIRNAVDHGIESTQERMASGKQGQGELLVKLYRQGANIILDIADDGRGINTAKVRQKAIAQGLIAETDAVTEQELCQFILRAGFSTADTVSHISGRGVGLDVVQDEITQIGGDIEILSSPGVGTTFRIRLPLTSSLNRALLFSVSGADYVMLLNTIDGIILEKNETLQRNYRDDKPAFFQYGDKSYELAYLGSMLGDHAVPEFQGGKDASSSLVLVSGAGKNLALHVDAVVGSRELVVKALGAQFASIPVLTGGVILGDGRVVVVLDPRFLVDSHVARKVIAASPEPAQPSEVVEAEFESGKTIMVVDDSITVRKVTSAILKRNGMNVILAKNGIEACELLHTTRPDIMLLDIEMPKMDGFEVAAYVRRQESGIKDLPIIMITSRIGEKHRSRAEEIGVNQYMCKPFQEVNLLEAIAGYN